MKLITCLAMLLSLTSLHAPIRALAVEAPGDLSAECAVLYDAENRRVLYGKNAENIAAADMLIHFREKFFHEDTTFFISLYHIFAVFQLQTFPPHKQSFLSFLL